MARSGKEDQIIAYTMTLLAFGVVEGLIGFWRGNVLVIRDFLSGLWMVGSLVLSYESAKNSRKKRSSEQTFGNRRLNVIAAFVNTVYI